MQCRRSKSAVVPGMLLLASLLLASLQQACTRPLILERSDGSSDAGEVADAGDAGDDQDATVEGPTVLTLRVPRSIRVRRSSQATFDVMIDRTGAAPTSLTVSASGLPLGAGIDSVTVAGTAGTATLTIQTSNGAVAGGPFTIALEVSTPGGSTTASATTLAYIAEAPGTPDATFGSAGVASVAIPRPAGWTGNGAFIGLAADADPRGRIVFAGGEMTGTSGVNVGFLLRVANDGTIDTTFDEDGFVTSLGQPITRCLSSTEAGDGRAVVCDTSGSSQFFLRKIDEVGQVDSSFGLGGDAECGQVSIVVGHAAGFFARATNQFAAVDTTGHSIPGGVLATLPPPFFNYYAFDVDGSGHPIIAGIPSNISSILVGKFVPGTTSYELETNFGTGGILTIPSVSGGSINPSGVSSDSDGGGFVLGGDSSPGGVQSKHLFAFTADGTLDPDFDTDGRIEVAQSTSMLVSYVDGAVTIGGWTMISAGMHRFVLNRFGATGAPDSTFGSNGSLNLPIEATTRTVVYEPDARRLILYGYAGTTITVKRYWM